MVYCGKPSKACAPCRARRTRCNGARPSCSQCLRAGRQCVGYRDATNMMFRHETEKVRLLNGDLDGIGTVVAPTSSSRRTSYSPKTQPPTPLQEPISRTLSPDPDDQATCFFFQNYVLDEASLARSHFDYLPAIYALAQESHNDALIDSIVAIGLAGLANLRKDRGVMIRANARYGKAVKKMSANLAMAETAREDATLVVVMLLSVYERETSQADLSRTNASDTPRSLRSWTSHIQGAIAILKLRGAKQLNTDLGRRIFSQIRSQIVLTCFQGNCQVPPELLQWSEILRPYNDANEVHSFIEIVSKFCSIRSSMSFILEYTNPLHVLAEGLVVDGMLHKWITSASPAFQYYSVAAMPSDDVFAGKYDVYPSVGAATMVNYYRCIRIILHEVILSQVAHLLPHLESAEHKTQYNDQIVASKELIRELKGGVCASVPFYFEYHLHDAPQSPGNGNGNGNGKAKKKNMKPVKAINGSLLLWFLYAVVVAGKIDEGMRSWIMGRIEAISERMGIRHAVGVARVLNMGKEIAIWDERKLAERFNGGGGVGVEREGEGGREEEGWEESVKVVLTSDELLD